MRRAPLILVLLLLFLAASCAAIRQDSPQPAAAAETPSPGVKAQGQPPARPEAGKPVIKVDTWKNGAKTTSGVSYAGDKLTTADGETLSRDDLKILNVIPPATEAVGYAGFMPLTPAQLEEYRRRAMKAAGDFPGIAGVACLDHGVDGLKEDGGHYYRYHGLVLVLKESRLDVANLSLWYEEGRTRSSILLGRSIQPDGSESVLKPGMIKVASRAEEDIYFNKNDRQVSATIPGVKIGSLVEFIYEIDLYNPDDPELFFPGFTFQGQEPFLDSILEVNIPKARKLNYATRNMAKEQSVPEIVTKDSITTYRWAMHDVPPFVPEAMMPPENDVLPNVRCSLFFEWGKLMEGVAKFQRERIAVTPELQKLADDLTAGMRSDDEKMKAIYEWVQRNIIYLSIKGSRSSGWSGHPAIETFKNGYGDCTDKAILTATLCKAAGIEAQPLIVKTNSEAAAYTEIPCMDANHCINVVYPDGRPRVIDATASDYRYPYFSAMDHGIKGVNCVKGEIIDIPVPPPEDNLKTSEQELVLAPDGSGTLSERNVYNGNYEAGLRGYWKTVPPNERKFYMQQYLQRERPGAQLIECEFADVMDLTAAFNLRMTYKMPRMATPAKDLLLLRIPTIQKDFPEIAKPTRQFPISTYTSRGLRTSLTVRLPEGFEVAAVPEKLAVESKHLHYAGAYAIEDSGRTLKATEEFDQKTRWIPVADFEQYRADALHILRWTQRQIVIKRVNK